MNETGLRWKARIGSLKTLALILIILVLILGVAVAGNILKALKNPQGTQAASILQLATGQVEADRFVSVSGLAVYKLAYQETENDLPKAIIYPLIDQQDNSLIFVRTTQTRLMDSEDARVTISGLTQRTAADLQRLIKKDMADINTAGFTTIDSLYIEEGRVPGNPLNYLFQAAALGIVLLLCAATFFFPSTVFQPFPVQPIDPGLQAKGFIKASGWFQQLKQIDPSMEFGRGRRKFVDSFANPFTMEGRWAGVHIHYVMSYRVYGIQVSKQQSDWAVVIKPTQTISLEPGKIYGWRDRWAVSFRYMDEANREQTLLLIFTNPAGQATYVNYLREKGYPVRSGMY